MARRTYFGVGFPKAPASPEPAQTDNGDDRSPPPADDDRTAERLSELRSWYQGDAAGESPPIDTPTPEQQQQYPAPPAARSTPVGHSSGGLPTPPRPHAPDPMRATMFGHQIHSFDFDQPSAPDLPPATNHPGKDAGPAGGAGRAPSPNRPPPASPPAPVWETPSPPDPSRLADYLRRQAAQPHPPVAAAWVSSVDEPHAHARWETPIVVVVVGVAALAASVVLALRTGDAPGGGTTPVPPVAVPVVPSPQVHRAPTPRSAPSASADLAAGPRQAVLQQVKRNVDDLAARLPPNTKPRPRPVKAQQPPAEEVSSVSGAEDQPNGPSPPIEASSDKQPRDKAPAGGPEPTQPPAAGN